jgi:general secretion pathway protein K
MKIVARNQECGIALIIVLIAMTVLGILAAGFAYSMKVETKLAQNANSESELIWLGRSGVEYARYILAQQLAQGCEPYDSLNQVWAGGSGGVCSSNSVLANVSLKDYQLGDGRFSLTITDLERKFNVNILPEPERERAVEQALRLVGVDPGDLSAITGSILDWIDPDNNTHMGGGTESDYYQSLNPPYYAKNKPVDDLSELLLVRGVTPEIFWGGVATNHPLAAFQRTLGRAGRDSDVMTYPVGLSEILTPISNGRININTASLTTLQMVPMIDENIAARIIEYRNEGEGFIPAMPIGSPGKTIGNALLNSGVNPNVIPQLERYFTVRSSTFEVQVDAEVAGYKRQFFAILARNTPRDVQVLGFYWK